MMTDPKVHEQKKTKKPRLETVGINIERFTLNSEYAQSYVYLVAQVSVPCEIGS